MSGLKEKTYEGKLKEIGLLSLAERRVYLELCETFKIVKGLTNVNRNELFELVSDTPRRATRATEYPLNLIAKRCNLDVRKHFYVNRVVNSWNSLPMDIKAAPSINVFKTLLNNHIMGD